MLPVVLFEETSPHDPMLTDSFDRLREGEHVILLSCVRRGKDTILLEGIRGFQHPIGQKKARILYSTAI